MFGLVISVLYLGLVLKKKKEQVSCLHFGDMFTAEVLKCADEVGLRRLCRQPIAFRGRCLCLGTGLSSTQSVGGGRRGIARPDLCASFSQCRLDWAVSPPWLQLDVTSGYFPKVKDL